MTDDDRARLPADVTDVEVTASQRASKLAERMSRRLGLWNTEVEAGLFLAGLALAHDAHPVDVPDDEATTLGRLGEAGDPGELDALAILAIVEGREGDVAGALADALPRWIEAGAEIAAPHLETTDPVDASSGVVELFSLGD